MLHIVHETVFTISGRHTEQIQSFSAGSSSQPLGYTWKRKSETLNGTLWYLRDHPGESVGKMFKYCSNKDELGPDDRESIFRRVIAALTDPEHSRDTVTINVIQVEIGDATELISPDVASPCRRILIFFDYTGEVSFSKAENLCIEIDVMKAPCFLSIDLHAKNKPEIMLDVNSSSVDLIEARAGGGIDAVRTKADLGHFKFIHET